MFLFDSEVLIDAEFIVNMAKDYDFCEKCGIVYNPSIETCECVTAFELASVARLESKYPSERFMETKGSMSCNQEQH